jgi:hypothetical protein
MVNIFGIKLFENSSIEEQMHHKGRKHHRRHGKTCNCPMCHNKKHGKTCNCHVCHKRKQYTRKHYKGGYRYNEKKKGLSMGEDVTMSLMSQTNSKTRINSKTRTKRRRQN